MDELHDALGIAGRGRPDFIALHASIAWDAAAVQAQAVRTLAGRHLHGGTSCLGVMGNGGARILDGRGMGAFAIWDDEGDYGVASGELGADPRAAAAAVTRAALADAGREGEAPELIWLTCAPGREELVLQGIMDVVGAHPRIMGGSAADDEVAGKWRQFDSRALLCEGIVVSVLFTSTPVSLSYQNGYAPAGPSALVTDVAGRQIRSLDGRPAADVYAEWVLAHRGDPLPEAIEGPASILADSTFFPLGRSAGLLNGVEQFALVHPAERHADGSMIVFADVRPGERVWLMQGSAESLVARAGRVAAQAAYNRLNREAPVAGALVIFCGGCMLAITDQMDRVAAEVGRALEGRPFLGIFTFGEQGVLANGSVEHANLMISCAAFEG